MAQILHWWLGKVNTSSDYIAGFCVVDAAAENSNSKGVRPPWHR